MSADSFIQNYAQVRLPRKLRIRNFLRNQVLDFSSFLSHRDDLHTPHVQFLYFHHVFLDEVAAMRSFIEKMGRIYTFVPYSEAIDKIATGNIDRPYISFSSDDGFKNNLESSGVFKEFGISCCYFICPSMIGETDFNRLASVSANTFHLPPVEFLNWNDVAALQQQGHEIGNHTYSHRRLTRLSQTEMEDEITRAHNELTTRCGDLQHFAYPYGGPGDITENARELVFGLGYRSCASATRGAYLPGRKYSIRELIKRDPVIFYKKDHMNYFISRNIRKAAAS